MPLACFTVAVNFTVLFWVAVVAEDINVVVVLTEVALTVIEMSFELDALNAPAPAYEAEIVWEPAAREDEVRVAFPPDRAAVPMEDPSS